MSLAVASTASLGNSEGVTERFSESASAEQGNKGIAPSGDTAVGKKSIVKGKRFKEHRSILVERLLTGYQWPLHII